MRSIVCGTGTIIQSDNCRLFFRALSALPDLSVWTSWIFEAYVQKDMLARVSLSLSLPSMPNWIAIFYKFPPCCFLQSDWFPRSTPPAENCYKNMSFLFLSFFSCSTEDVLHPLLCLRRCYRCYRLCRLPDQEATKSLQNHLCACFFSVSNFKDFVNQI